MTDTNSDHGTAAKASYDFAFPPPRETLVRVERVPEGVLIRANRHTFGEARKKSFVHQLAAEGFIPDEYQQFDGFEKASPRISWIVDSTWVMPGRRARAETNGFMCRLLIVAGLIWIGSLVGLFIRH
jgi:hypothetical protein